MMKMKDLRTFNFGIPAFRSKSGFTTCPQAGVCASGCFARGGWYTHRPVVKDKYEWRLELARSTKFEETINKEIKELRVGRLRWNDSGDFFDQEYLQKCISVMEANPAVRFYAYTKMVSLLRSVSLPSNFTVVYSYGGKEDHLIKETDRHCRVFETHEELEAAGYADASDNDAVAAEGPNHKVAIVYHGQRHYKNTLWRKANDKQRVRREGPALHQVLPGGQYAAHQAAGVQVPQQAGRGLPG
jgi:hypothetical protein